MPEKPLLYMMAVSILIAASMPSCRASDEKLLQNLLQKRGQALKKGHPEEYLSCLKNDYHDSFFPLDSAAEKIRRVLSSPDRPLVRFGSRDVYIKGNRAVVREEFSLEGMISGNSRRYDRTQYLRLQKCEANKNADTWKIESGSQVYRLLAGQADEEDKIEEALNLREKALEEKDIELYLSVVSQAYSHRGRGFKKLEQDIKETFRVFDNIQYEAWGRKISYFGNYALVEQRYRLKAKLMGSPQLTSGTELLELIPEAEGWKIVKGI
jgi:hypothetical protein